MITDIETNKVYLSSLIKTEKYKDFWNVLEAILKKHGIHYGFVEGTRDIWCRDYMPIQVDKTEFVKFKYFPNYCLDYDNIKTLTIQDELSYDLPSDSKFTMVDLIVDGGNIVKSKNKAILTTKVFDENSSRLEKTVTEWLKAALKVDELHIIPIQPYDYTGHSDGMVRFLDDQTLLINDYSMESDSWQRKFKKAIESIGIEILVFPYAHTEKKVDGDWTADGCYINYAQIGNVIIFPQFQINKDGEALTKIRELYPEPEFHIEPIDSRVIAERGGVLNCITWNIYKHITNLAIDDIIPVYGDEQHMVVIRDDESKNSTDKVCVVLFPEKGIVGNAGSLQRLMKRIEPIDEIPESMVSEFKRILAERFSVEQLSDIERLLRLPEKRVVDELVQIPETLRGYIPK